MREISMEMFGNYSKIMMVLDLIFKNHFSVEKEVTNNIGGWGQIDH